MLELLATLRSRFHALLGCNQGESLYLLRLPDSSFHQLRYKKPSPVSPDIPNISSVPENRNHDRTVPNAVDEWSLSLKRIIERTAPDFESPHFHKSMRGLCMTDLLPCQLEITNHTYISRESKVLIKLHILV